VDGPPDTRATGLLSQTDTDMLEIVITGRHDNYGGSDFQDRLCAAADHNHRLLTAHGIDHRFTLAEWNPVAGRRLFADIVRERLPWWHHCLVVDPVWHERSSTNPRLQFMEFFAKNAAIRRSPADAILTTNSDVFLSTEVVRKLATLTWNDRVVYRAVRIDIDRNVNWRSGGEAVISDPAWQLRVNDVQPPEYGNSAGDFLLLTKAAWLALGGFNERVRFAKIHKDGQFCIHARLEGYAFEVLGPIYHVDHDGSYANAGAMRGSPDAPYGPEWDYRSGYRNARSWGLTAGIDVPGEPGVIHVKHPSTHGELLTVIEVAHENDAAAVNAGLAGARGRWIAIGRRGGLEAFGDRASLERTLADMAAGIVVPTGTVTQHPTLGPVPAIETPVIYRRDVIDALVDWEPSDTSAAIGFWLRATEVAAVAEVGPARAGHPTGVERPLAAGPAPRPIGASLEAQVLTRRGISVPAAVLTAAVAEHREAACSVAGYISEWVRTIAPEADAVCAVAGPDWATTLLIEAIFATGRRFGGLFSAAATEVGTQRHGERVRPLDDVARLPGGSYLLTGCEGPLAERLVLTGWSGSLHALSDHDVQAGETANDEIDATRRAQARDLAAKNVDRALARLPLLELLEGERAAYHVYDIAAACEQAQRADESLAFFRRVFDAPVADEPLRMRAAFHVARLSIARGDADRVCPLLEAVIAHNPDHRAARALLETATLPQRRSA
jgi:hypothetical protein